MVAEIRLCAHDQHWAVTAEAERRRLLAAAAGLTAVHHIGSTAVPGLAAKPIVDLLGIAAGIAALDAERPAIEALGYEWRGEYGLPGRRYCVGVDAAGRHRVHLHCYADGDPAIDRHLAFRDHLRRRPGIAADYQRVKERCARLHPADGAAYTVCKSRWIARVVREALQDR